MGETQAALVGTWRAETTVPGSEEPVTTSVDVVQTDDGGLEGRSSQTVNGESMVGFSVTAVGNGEAAVFMGNVLHRRDDGPLFRGLLTLMQRRGPVSWAGTLISDDGAPVDGTITLTRKLPDWPCSISASVR